MPSPSTFSADGPSDETPSRRIPSWVPISAFVGTSLALAIPLLLIRRQRAGVARLALKDTTGPPPRRSTTFVRASLPTASTTTATAGPARESYSEGTPGVGDMMSALSRMNSSSALLAAKAFGIATALVAVGGVGLTWGVKTVLGVQDAREFGRTMRFLMWSFMPSLADRIRRAPETDDERHQVRQVVPLVALEEEWSWDKAEQRLNKAYQEGGISVWAQMALREVEAEVKAERAKKEREFAKG